MIKRKCRFEDSGCPGLGYCDRTYDCYLKIEARKYIEDRKKKHVKV